MSSYATGDSPHPAATRGQSVTIPLLDKAGRVDGHWQPRVIAEMNDYQFKVVKMDGDFVWHSHADTDETFLVLDGELRIALRDGEIVLRAGEMAVVPRGVEHKPYAGRRGAGAADRAARRGQYRRRRQARAHRAERCLDLSPLRARGGAPSKTGCPQAARR